MSERLNSLDLLRGVAAATVAGAHFAMHSHLFGELAEAVSIVAVEVFFVLSGFVLAPQILHVVRGDPRSDLPVFLVRRWMRTVPPYLIALVMVSTISGALGSGDFIRYLFYVQNLFGQHVSRDFYPVAWSLSVEEWFYVAFPPFMLLAAAWAGRSDAALRNAALALILITTAGRLLFGQQPDWGAEVRRVVVFRIDAIAWGFVLYLAVRNGAVRLAGGVLCVASVAGFLSLVALTGQLEESRLAQFCYPLGAAFFGCSLIAWCLSVEEKLRRFNTLADASGRLSYPIYLFHLVALYVVSLLGDGVGVPVKAAAFVALVLGIAAFSAYMIEAPILEMRPRYRKRAEGA